MRSLFTFLGAALVAFLVLGWFLDWYKISTTPTDGGRRQVKIDLNIPKIGEDFKKGEQKAEQVIEKVSNKAKPESPAAKQAETDPKAAPAPADAKTEKKPTARSLEGVGP
jgi:hypothetical protein